MTSPLTQSRLVKIGKISAVFITACILGGTMFFSVVYALSEARNDRDWSLDQSVLPLIEWNGDSVMIRNVRNFSYTSTTTYTPNYYDRTYDLSMLTSVDFIVEPLKSIGIAHTFLSFGFENGDHVAISAEVRKEKGELFSPLKGLIDKYELMYVIADERDVIQLRALHRKDPVYLYPVNISKEKARELFESMLRRAEKLSREPEFYHSITNTCTTNIVDHINALSKKRVPWDVRILFPKDSDEYAYELGLIDTSIPFEELRKRQLVNEHVEIYKDLSDFSVLIRKALRGEIVPPSTSSE